MIITKNTTEKEIFDYLNNNNIRINIDVGNGVYNAIDYCKKKDEKLELIIENNKVYIRKEIKMYKSRLEQLRVLLNEYKQMKQAGVSMIQLTDIIRDINKIIKGE